MFYLYLAIYLSTSETWIGNFFLSHKQLQDNFFRRNIVPLINFCVGESIHIYENPEITCKPQTGLHKFTDEQQNTVRSYEIGSCPRKSTDSHENGVRSCKICFAFAELFLDYRNLSGSQKSPGIEDNVVSLRKIIFIEFLQSR